MLIQVTATSRRGISPVHSRFSLVAAGTCAVRRECLAHIVVCGARPLRHVLLLYMQYYNGARTHLSLNNDAPVPRAVQASGRILPIQFSADYTISQRHSSRV